MVILRTVRHLSSHCTQNKVSFLRQLHTSNLFWSKKKEVLKRRRTNHEDYQVFHDLMTKFIAKGNLTYLNDFKAEIIKLCSSSSINNTTFDSHFLNICTQVGAFNVGNEYFQRLYIENKVGMGAIGKFFTLCHANKDKCSTKENDLILKIYDELLVKYEVLDVSTCEAMARGVGLTDRWRTEIPRLIDMVTLSDTAPSRNLLSIAVESALHHGDVSRAWEFMDCLASSGKQLCPKVFETILTFPSQLPWMLRWLSNHGIQMNKPWAEVIKRLAPVHNARAQFSQVAQNGVCGGCGISLRPTPLTPKEYSTLSSAFLDPVLIGGDVFRKTRPEELTAFHAFLDKVLPVDVVLDGLNISYLSRKLSPSGSKLLKHVTSHFVTRQKKVLVIGRQHMNVWPSEDMKYIKKHADMFLAENISEDDPFLLYATLKSGLGTKFVSRDRMNGHRFLLGKPELQRIFSTWQSLHQYHPLHVSNCGNYVALKSPQTFASVPQQTSPDLWHLPCIDHTQTNVPGHLQDSSSPWLCVSTSSV